MKKIIKKILMKLNLYELTIKLIAAVIVNRKRIMFKLKGGSVSYWETRYKNGGNSGAGSYNRLAQFKAETINDFLEENREINSCIEWGCGDGNQLALMNYKKYVGIDVSKTIIECNKKKFKDDLTKEFFESADFLSKAEKKYDLSILLDVIFHLVENKVFESYMKNLFKYSNKYVCIYSNNEEKFADGAHVRNRVFTDWIDENEKEWKLVKFVEQKYPSAKATHADSWKDTSACDFYFYKKIC